MQDFKSLILVCVILSIIFTQCKNTNSSIQSGTDLMKYGIPFTIYAPADIKITKVGTGRLTDVSIKNESGYDVQIFMSDAFSNDLTKLKAQKKDEIRSNPYFTKIVEEYDDGFIYENTNESNKRSFDFIIIKIQGDKELTFQCGNSKEFTETDVKNMVASIQN